MMSNVRTITAHEGRTMADESRVISIKKAGARSRVTNGRTVLPGVDNRTERMRRLRDLIGQHVADLGGEDQVTSAEMAIIRRACTLMVELELLEVRFAEAGEASADQLDLHSRVSGNLRRLLESLGLQRRPRRVSTVKPSALHSFVEASR